MNTIIIARIVKSLEDICDEMLRYGKAISMTADVLDELNHRVAKLELENAALRASRKVLAEVPDWILKGEEDAC